MTFQKDFKDLEKTGIMSREMAIGTEAHEHLLELEGNTKELERRRIKDPDKQNCLYCGVTGEIAEFPYRHKCKMPLIIITNTWKMPSRPKQVSFFEVSYYGSIHRFKTWRGALKFRRLVYKKKIPLKEVLKDKTLGWYK